MQGIGQGGAYMVIFLLLALIFSFVVGASAPTAAFVASPLVQSPGNSDELFNCYYELSFGVLHLTCDFHALTAFCNTYAKLARNVPAS